MYCKQRILSLLSNRRTQHKRHVLRRRDQWSFHKTGTMGTLATQAEIGVSKHRERFCGGPGVLPPETF